MTTPHNWQPGPMSPEIGYNSASGPGSQAYPVPAAPGHPVPAAVQFASPGQRFVARLIDWFLFFFVVLVIAFIPVVGWILGPIAGVLLAVSYELFFNLTAGRTPGKSLTRIRIVRAEDGGRPAGSAHLGRAFVLFVPGILPVIGWMYQILVALSIFFGGAPRYRAWQDLAGKTVVIASS